MATATWLASVLRLSGIEVVEHPGWQTRSHGDFKELRAICWHHDASPAGTSPGVPAYMIRNWNNASANCWVALDGTWHLIGAGVSYHAGKVLPGKPDNWSSLGIETDHTTGETWSGVRLLDSLRRGTAAILRHLGHGSDGLEFHRTICSPPGRKTDPDGLDLVTERHAVAALLIPHFNTGGSVATGGAVVVGPSLSEDLMAIVFRDPKTRQVFVVEGGKKWHIERPALTALQQMGATKGEPVESAELAALFPSA